VLTAFKLMVGEFASNVSPDILLVKCRVDD